MSETLIDTSAWVAALRGSDPIVKAEVDRLLEEDQVLFCGAVEMELLHGVRPKEMKTLLSLFKALRYIEVDRSDWQAAGALLNELRIKGKTIPATDALIAALCLRRDVPLLTLDKHFDEISKLRIMRLSKKSNE